MLDMHLLLQQDRNAHLVFRRNKRSFTKQNTLRVIHRPTWMMRGVVRSLWLVFITTEQKDVMLLKLGCFPDFPCTYTSQCLDVQNAMCGVVESSFKEYSHAFACKGLHSFPMLLALYVVFLDNAELTKRTPRLIAEQRFLYVLGFLLCSISSNSNTWANHVRNRSNFISLSDCVDSRTSGKLLQNARKNAID